jgi:uncharacterized protein YkwD
VTLAVLAAGAAVNPEPAGFPPGAARFDPSAEAQLLTLTNQARSHEGLAPLVVDQRLTQAARKHSALMEQQGLMEHQLPGEPPLQIRIANEAFPGNELSENIAMGNEGIVAAHDGFMHSPPHRRAILDPTYDTIGIGVLRDGEYIYVTEDFARKLPEYSEPQAEAAVQAAIDGYAKAHGIYTLVRRQQRDLRRMACNMPLQDRLQSDDALHLPGVRNVLAWTASDPAQLPKGIAQVLTRQTSGDALGACFAPSVSHPGGVYWIVLVTY